ncbi:MAG: ASCH domain-containing protein, partial [Lachnospiraceae bacterium]|nr:ASCH domain-containing protein [Lachnospiraceae bacterium]
TSKITICPFKDVTAEHAYKEGEGDRSLEYWRQVHKEFLESELETINMPFSEEAKVICEEFELVNVCLCAMPYADGKNCRY